MSVNHDFAIEVVDLKKSINGEYILGGVTAKFKKNAVNIIVGPSGTGKSVFFQCLLGLIDKDAGKINFCGGTENTLEILKNKKKIGVLFQNPVFYEEKTVFENVKFALEISSNKYKKERIPYVIREYLKKVDLLDSEDKYPHELSGGMQKKLGIAMALILKPKYLFCDEPDSGLDPNTAPKIMDLIRMLTKKEKITTIVISHILVNIFKGDYIVFLDKTDSGSKCFWEGDVKDVVSSHNEKLENFLMQGVPKDIEDIVKKMEIEKKEESKEKKKKIVIKKNNKLNNSRKSKTDKDVE